MIRYFQSEDGLQLAYRPDTVMSDLNGIADILNAS